MGLVVTVTGEVLAFKEAYQRICRYISEPQQECFCVYSLFGIPLALQVPICSQALLVPWDFVRRSVS